MRVRPTVVFSVSAPRSRGSVIVVVLVTLLLASLMLTKFIETSAVELTLATRQADRARLRGDAYGALETALAVMAEIKAVDKDLYAPAQGWGDPYEYAGEAPREGVRVEFAFTDESGKASLPNMSPEDMIEFVQVLGLGENDAKRFADGLYTWIKADFTPTDLEAEASRYERETIPHEPPKRSLRSWDELRAVRVARDFVYDENGALTPFGVALRQNLSLYAFESSNVNGLAPALGTARGWDETQTKAVASYREGKTPRPPGAPTWFRETSDLTSILGAKADVEGLDAVAKLVRIDVTVHEGAASMRLSALVGLDSSVKLPSAVSANGSESGGNGGNNGNGGSGGAPGRGSGGGRGNNGGGGRGNGNGNGGVVTPGTRPGRGQGGGQQGGGVRPGGSRPGGGMSLQQANPNGPGRANGNGNGRANRSGNGETSGTGGTSEEKLDYPFSILEVIETADPAPAVPVAEAEETPPSQ